MPNPTDLLAKTSITDLTWSVFDAHGANRVGRVKGQGEVKCLMLVGTGCFFAICVCGEKP
jgi:hypothetical protein